MKRYNNPIVKAKREKKISKAKTPKEIAEAIDYGLPNFKAKFRKNFVGRC
jgi:hypothetical protein